MKVALYYPWVYLRSGCERTIAEVLARSRHEWTVLTNRFEPESTFPEINPARVIEMPRVSVDRSTHKVLAAGWKIGRQKLPLSDHQALVVFCEGVGDFATFRNSRLPLVCLCFTPLRAAFDPHYQKALFSRKRNKKLSELLVKGLAAAFRFADRVVWKKYAHIFAISSEVKARIVRGGLARAEKVEVLHPGIDPNVPIASCQYQPYFLIPGRIMWTKNLELAIDAFQQLLVRRPDLRRFRLVITGFVDVKSRPYVEMLRERAARTPQIEIIEGPSDSELAHHYEHCYAVVYPPFNEDWGLVPLEAMLRSKPVIATNRGGPCETILHERTGLLVEPVPADFARAMEAFADDPALVRTLGAAARSHAQNFDWQVFCDRLDNCLDELVGARCVAPRRPSLNTQELSCNEQVTL
ncbi:MAG TPA: glycosyltransferase family 4 protein [Bryobacteraceae bacterium]|jgi:glycosyltransferase involved in cell wall biosynthesis|nr:glycosyltransferase family 4 protein [Bryobacteraceae bacterium]